MASLVHTEIPGESIRDLEQRWGITRNALKGRAEKLGVKLQPVSQNLTIWPAAFLDLAEQYHKHLSQGLPSRAFAGIKPSVPSPIAVTETEKTMIASIEQATRKLITAITAISDSQVLAPFCLQQAANADIYFSRNEMHKLFGRRLGPKNDGEELRPGYFVHYKRLGSRAYWRISHISDSCDSSDTTALHLISEQ